LRKTSPLAKNTVYFVAPERLWRVCLTAWIQG
jgi:hypothetical protein